MNIRIDLVTWLPLSGGWGSRRDCRKAKNLVKRISWALQVTCIGFGNELKDFGGSNDWTLVTRIYIWDTRDLLVIIIQYNGSLFLEARYRIIVTGQILREFLGNEILIVLKLQGNFGRILFWRGGGDWNKRLWRFKFFSAFAVKAMFSHDRK